MPADPQTPASPIRCAACAAVVDTPLFCEQCGAAAPSDGVDHFRLLGLEPGFDVDDEKLRRGYFELSRRLHPDRVAAGRDPAALLRAAARVNEAYQALRDPLRRAEYLLALHGGASSLEDREVPQDVLSESLLLREEIQETPAADEAGRAALQAQVDAGFERWRERVSDATRRLPGDAETRRDLRRALNAIRYYQRMREQLTATP